MSAPQPQAVGRREQLEAASAAALRALSGARDVDLRAGWAYRGLRRLAIGGLPAPPSDDRLEAWRGHSDALALRLRYSDPQLHHSARPEEPVAGLVFDLLEQQRVESLAGEALPGVRANLAHHSREWALATHRCGFTQSPTGLLLYTVVQICRSRLTGDPVLAETEGLIESTRFALAPEIGADLAQLRRHRRDQQAFARHAASIAAVVARHYAELRPERGRAARADASDRLAEFMPFDAGEGDDPAAAARGDRGIEASDTDSDYRAFTTDYDDQRRAEELVRGDVLRERRVELDHLITTHGISPGRVARLVATLFGEPAPAGWEGGLEEGVIDGRRLPLLVTSPAERRLFRREQHEAAPLVHVTLLVDCSGSMKAHSRFIAVLVDVAARAIEQAGGRCEVLGFTTAAWHGGRARRDWVKAGKPAHPGRLNERRHLIFKDTDTPWQRARAALAALLHEEFYREGIDGEALEWATARAAGRPEQRRLLFVFSDGSPMDSATATANDPGYLDRHLREVVARAHGGPVEVFGVGVGLDLGSTYPRSRVLDVARGPRHATFAEMLGLAAPVRRGGR